MDAVALTEHMLKNIREKKEQCTQILADGAVEDYTNYRFIVGQIRSLQYCEDELIAAMKGVIEG
jgi:hypothetical protein|tara:strand:- start:545 stop:736 length:192 start_codon:yes stop_codon:yes gene_type:complete